ncbi:hypothetical protein PMAYCL1PPCAC_28028, partial [Pristionchus mayeri]
LECIVPGCFHLIKMLSALFLEVSDDPRASGSAQSVDEEQLEPLTHSSMTANERELRHDTIQTVDLKVDDAAYGIGNHSVNPEHCRNEGEGVHDSRDE